MMVAAEREPWQNPRILTILTLVFIAGAATGALFMQFGVHGWMRRAPAPPAQSAQSHDAILNRFKNELNLSNDQTAKLSLVLDDYSQYYESLQEQLNDLRATGKTRIMSLLDQDQRARFEKMMGDLAPQLASPAPAAK